MSPGQQLWGAADAIVAQIRAQLEVDAMLCGVALRPPSTFDDADVQGSTWVLVLTTWSATDARMRETLFGIQMDSTEWMDAVAAVVDGAREGVGGAS